MPLMPHTETVPHDDPNDVTHDDLRWQAVLTRDRRGDGRFVYAVGSTHIYCRPSCPSRRPRREHVRFFGSPADAELAGFRACLRCLPQELHAPDEEMVRRLCRYVDAHPNGPTTLASLGTHVGLSPSHLQRQFKAVVGVTPRQYVDSCRLDRFKQQLREGGAVTDALYDAGYRSSSQLYTSTPTRMGMTPTSYRAGGEGAKIIYTTMTTKLGCLLVAATPRGLCKADFGDSADDLEATLVREFPAATIHRDDDALRAWTGAISRHLDDQEPRLDLPLDVQGTLFQAQVWHALRAIPYGNTTSYGDVAQSIGRPAAARAVAQACAANPLAVVIPCHRVVPHDGSLGGYRWGVDRKRSLLAGEAQCESEPDEP